MPTKRHQTPDMSILKFVAFDEIENIDKNIDR
jgi:hypothetical protein